ncbi:hypothetical protein N7478_001139 [Penicillium angulare]|uniref:uncharacterized protein n=1 Tax=Penicillium angulare TaxID=116970 RepID=UPI00253F95CD|nr:uncharacterized protein N7478_001139 [Penicillium angulare]KAJ5291888.1 hypothetical protein N7478_001139 [Penicillium angulare]
MRTWANLPAGLRASSWASAPAGNLSVHYNRRFSNTALLSRGELLRTLVGAAPHAEESQHAYPYDRRSASQGCLRRFSTTPTSRIRLEDDEDEHNELSKPEPQRPVRRVAGRPLPTQSKDMRTLILSRKPIPLKTTPVTPPESTITQESPPPPPCLTPQQLREELHAIATKFELLLKPDISLDDVISSRYIDAENYMAEIIYTTQRISSAVAEILHIHTQQLLTILGESRATCQQFERRYCNIVYHRTPQWRIAVSKSQREVSRLKTEFSELLLPVVVENVQRSQGNVTKMRKLINSQYLLPRQSARANIDKVLSESEQVHTEYAELQSKGKKAIALLEDIILLTISLKNLDLLIPSRNGPKFDDFRLMLSENKKEFGWAAHSYRSVWVERKQAESSFQGAQFWSAKDFTEVLRSRKIREESCIEVARCRMFADILRRPRELALFHREAVIAKYLRRLYMSKWTAKSKRTDNYLLDITWRQLDVMAPFEIKIIQDWWLQEEIYFLLRSFDRQTGPYGPMWSNVDSDALERVRDSLKILLAGYAATRKAFIEEMSTYRHINWHRLKIEEKLHNLGEPIEYKERGVLVPAEPLSGSTIRFNHWLKLYAAVGFRAWVLRKLNILSAEYTTNELGHKVTQYARLSQIFLKTVQAPFVPEGGSVISAKHNSSLARQRRSAGLRVRPVLPLFIRKFDDSLFPSDKTDSPPSSDGISQGDATLIERKASSKSSSKEQSRNLRRANPLKPNNGQINFFDSVSPTPNTGRSVAQHEETSQPKLTSKPRSSETTTSKAFEKSKTTNSVKQHPGPPSSSENKQSSYSERIRFQKSQHPKSDSAAKPNQNNPSSPTTYTVKKKHYGTPWRRSSFADAPQNGRRPYSSSTGPSNIISTTTDDDKVKETSKHSLPSGVLPMAETIEDSIPVESKAKSAAAAATAPLFWSHSSQRSPSGQKLIVHYCRSLQSTEEVAQLFLNSKIIGFDMEWKAQAFSWDSIQNNISVIQMANEERIALFHLALFKPGKSREDFIAPSLQRIMESSDITKVGVAIKADTTRLRKFLGIKTSAIFELSHLFRLLKFSWTNPKLVNKRGVSLSDQALEHLGLPLEKSEDVRCGDWTVPLSYRQVQYAATDPYACICLFNVMDQKRQAMVPMPPLPAHAELNMPIVLPRGEAVNNEEPVAAAMDDAAVVDGS